MLAVSAMRSIGEENLTDEIMNKIKEVVKKVTPENYNHDIRLAPLWVRKKLEV